MGARILAGVVAIAAASSAEPSGAAPAGTEQASAKTVPATAAPVAPRVLPPGTQVRLMVIDEVSTRRGRAGDKFVVRVDQPVMNGGTAVIPAGTPGVGEIVAASGSGIGGRSGKLATRLLYLDIGGRHVRVDGNFTGAGQGAGRQMIAFATMINPIGMFARGNNAKLKAGDIVTGVLAEGFDPDEAAVTP